MDTINDSSAKIADFLLQIKAIKLNTKEPFTWASGLKAPIYCDNRKTLSYPQIRTFIRQEFVNHIIEKYGKPDVIAGVATGGIPHGILVAQELALPFIYVRNSEKQHGLKNLIEGYYEPGQSVIVIEDLISTGGSSIRAIQALRDGGCIVNGLVSIFNYSLKSAVKNFKEINCKFSSLSNFDVLIKRAVETKYIEPNEEKILKKWNKNPEEWDPLNI